MDYISREDAIKAIAKYYNDKKYIKRSLSILSAICVDMENVIKSLPAADVAERELDEWCYGCKEYDSNKHNCPRFRRVIRDTVDECKAINVERKKGKWIDKPDPYGFFDTIPVCSECGCTTKYREKTSFCPHCGTDMREVDE